MKTLHDPDGSVNFIWPSGYEARYVRRTAKKLVVYLSSQTGCSHRCRFCHLTTTEQFKAVNATVIELVHQAQTVLSHYDTLPGSAEVCHFDFMARGEPLANPNIWKYPHHLWAALARLAEDRGMKPEFLISTIMPRSVSGRDLTALADDHWPHVYYSIYSVYPDFRKKWLPMAMGSIEALTMLRRYQEAAMQSGGIGQPTKRRVRLHWCFITGENDEDYHVLGICDEVKAVDLDCDVNIVRYNSAGPEYGEEPSTDRVYDLAVIIARALPRAKVKVVDRVGFDVKASCGMFVNLKE